MNSMTTFLAFSDEMTKIALFQGLVNTLKEGWHGSLDPNSPDRTTWFGKGRQITPGMGRIGRAWEDFSSLGGATKALPIGAKSIAALSTGLMARDALRRNDLSGLNRSRTERLTGLTGNTLGGLMGAAVGNRISPGLAGNLIGGYIGGAAGEKLITSPFSKARMERATQARLQQPQPYEGAQV